MRRSTPRVDSAVLPLSGRPRSSILASSLKPKPSLAISQEAHTAKASRAEVNRTLDDAWREAREEFKKRTGRGLEPTLQVDLDTYMETWAKTYEVDPSVSAQRKRRFAKVVQNIIDGFQVVGGLVAEGASMAFPPAGLCFSAFSFLIELPKRIKGVYDTLLELFEEVENFLVRFKILKRIDSRGKLSTEIITSANKMLISFVDICSMSIDLLQNHKIKTALKAALLNNDSDTGSSLASFRGLAQSLDSLTSTVAFEHVVSIEETGKDTNEMVRAMAATNNDEKTKMVNQGLLNKIEEKIYARGERPLAEESVSWSQDAQDLLPQTTRGLKQMAEYQRWCKTVSNPNKSVLLLNGDRGTGRSCLLQALKGELDEQRRAAGKDQPSVYVALQVFSDRPTKITDIDQKSGPASSLIPAALRNMAVQVARQSTHYAVELERLVSTSKSSPISQIDNIEELWKALRLSTFSATPGATMYLLFDGVDRESEGKFKSLLSLFASSDAEQQQGKDALSVRAILTINSKLRSALDFPISEVAMYSATNDLIQPFAETLLHRRGIFQDADKRSVARRQEIIQAVQRSSKELIDAGKRWSFLDVEQKLRLIHEAIQNDASSHNLKEILADDSGQKINSNAKRELAQLAMTIAPKQVAVINQILPWILYSQSTSYMRLEELEAALYLASNKDSLQSLAQKMRDLFGDLFIRSGGYVWLSQEFEDTLRQLDDEPMPGSKEATSLITLDISIKNAEESVVRQFIWQLNENVTSGKFDLSAGGTDSNGQRIYANKLQGHLAITKLCLKLLNEGWREDTEALLWYSREFLPRHFVFLNDNILQISSSERSSITHGLVSFLNDPYYLEHDQDRHFGSGEYWLADTASREGLRSWLKATMHEAQTRERRWIELALQPAQGGLGFMKDVARAVARKWTSHQKDNAKDRELEEGVRASNSLECSLFNWLDKYIQNELEYRAKHMHLGYTIKAAELNDGLKIKKSAFANEYYDQYPKLWRLRVTATVPMADRVLRGINWAESHCPKAESILVWSINLGYTYLSQRNFAEAEKKFKSVLEYFEHTRGNTRPQQQALTGLGRTYWARGEKESGVKFMQDAVSMIDQSQNKMFAEDLREIAKVYEELGQKGAAISSYEQSLQFSDDLDIRWRILILLGEESPAEDALQRLAKWSDSADEYGDRWLAQSIFRSAHDGPFWQQLSLLVYVIRDEVLRASVVLALSEAAQIAKKDPLTQARPGLLYLQGMAIARGTSMNARQTAVEIWRDALWSTAPEGGTEFGFKYGLYLAAKGVALGEFEEARAEIARPRNSPMSKEEKIVAVQQLQSRLQMEALRNAKVMSEARAVVKRYIVSLHVMLGEVDEARELLVPDTSNALGILRDDDPENDLVGIKILSRTLCAMGDKIGALTAFSLLDRQRRSLQRVHATAVADTIVAECDGCRRAVSSADLEGFWWCQFCADFDLCSECHRSFVSGNLNLHHCDPDHSFMRLYHTEYSDEEVAEHMVRIGWEWVDLGDGKFARKDGRIVPVLEWLEELRLSWRLPEPQTELRAQK